MPSPRLVSERGGGNFSPQPREPQFLTIYYTDEPEYLAEALSQPPLKPAPHEPPPPPRNDGQASER